MRFLFFFQIWQCKHTWFCWSCSFWHLFFWFQSPVFCQFLFRRGPNRVIERLVLTHKCHRHAIRANVNKASKAVSTGILCYNLAESESVLKMCFSKHCHEVTGFLLWIGTYFISCVVQQRSRIKDLFSLVGYDDSCLVAIRHVKSIVRVIKPRPNIRSHSVLL